MTLIQVPNEPEPEYREVQAATVEEEDDENPYKAVALDVIRQATPGLSNLVVDVISGLVQRFSAPGNAAPPAEQVVESRPALPEGIRPPIRGVRQSANPPAVVVTQNAVPPAPPAPPQNSQPLGDQYMDRISRSEILCALQDVYAIAEQVGLDMSLGEAVDMCRQFEPVIVDGIYKKVQSGEYAARVVQVDDDTEIIVVPNGDDEGDDFE